jgi:hypothetical protein
LKHALLIFLIFTGVFTFAQKNNLQDQIIEASGILYEDSSLSISYNKVNCYPKIGFDQEVLILTFQNFTNQNLKLSWHSILYYNGVCKTCDYPEEYTFERELMANEIQNGNCDDFDQRFVVFSKFIDPGYKGNAQLTGMRIENLTIQK